MPVPSNEEVKKLLEDSYTSNITTADLHSNSETLFQFGHLDELFADDVEMHVSGHEFHLAGKHKGKAAVKDHIKSDAMPSLSEVIDVTKPIKGSVLHVIGGQTGADKEWKAVVLHSDATTKKGKPWNNEMVVLLHFNSQGKIFEMRAYADTQHVHNHIQDNKS